MLATIAAIIAIQGAPNTLTPAEARAGWKLLFDGRTTRGWHNFKARGIGKGWQVKNGALICADPKNAGDIVSDEQFDWFELKLEYNIGKGENSGIMFRVIEVGGAAWQSGPEVQLFDNASDPEVQKSGWLYQLYKSDTDSTKPAGEWNQVRILVSPGRCETDINGIKYYEYVLGSDDFWGRVAKSKFKDMPYFARAPKGSIAFQGDHGLVSFRNVKIRPIREQTAGRWTIRQVFRLSGFERPRRT